MYPVFVFLHIYIKNNIFMEKDKRVNISFSIKESVKDAFFKYCEQESINKSQLIEKLIKQYCESKSTNV